MRTRIVRIGSSQGIYLPERFVEQVGLGSEVELEVRAGEIVITPVKGSRPQPVPRGDRSRRKPVPAPFEPGEWNL